jgi:GNAT superfamily N-acetyltransferase
MPSKSELISPNIIQVQPLQLADVEKLDPVLRQHVHIRGTDKVDEFEIEEIKSYMKGEPDDKGRHRQYFVAKSVDGSVLGCMSYANMSPGMARHFSDLDFHETVQLLNAFVDEAVFRGQGVGRKLFETICNVARSEGKNYLTVNSGLRYQDSWGFYDKMCDEDRGILINKKNPLRNAKTWLKRL